MDYYVIGISPPDPLYGQVVNFQMGKACALVEPHITIKAQCGLVDPPYWTEKVRAICISTPPFPARVGDVFRFGSDVIYLGVESPGLISLHKCLVNAISPTKEENERYHEMEDFIPHLTLAQNIPGREIENFEDVVSEARSRFVAPSKIMCRSVKIYRSSSQFGQYRVFKEYRLGEESRH